MKRVNRRSNFEFSGLKKLFSYLLSKAKFSLKELKKFFDTEPLYVKLGSILLVIVIVLGVFIPVIDQFSSRNDYNLDKISKQFLDKPVDLYAQKLQYDSNDKAYKFNDGYVLGAGYTGDSSSPKFTASFYSDPKKGVTVTDPVYQTTATFKPKFKLKEPIKDQNRLVYPIKGMAGQKIYTLKATGFKEDIVLAEYTKDTLKFEYEIELGEGLEPRLEPDGSLAIYGVDASFLGPVSTGTDQDAELLRKARESGEKNNLLYRIPAPFILEGQKKLSSAKAWFSLEDNVLTVHAGNLKEANFPISIDPSVYIETASKLMRGNNESNIDFDVDNELIQKGKTTGGRFDAWTSTLALPSARWNHSTAVAGGYIYVAGGNSGSAQTNNVYWARFNPNSSVIEASNPGAGACSDWCTNSAYNLPSARDAASLVAYNGYLYLFGGRDSGGSRTSTVYIAKIGANGEPSLWHPTDTNKNNWVYWYLDTSLSSERSFLSATAYNNRMYILGGQTNASSGGVTTVEYANISPIGTLSSWTSTGMVALPSARHSHTIQVYNDRMYLIGGNSSGTLQSSVHYIKMGTDGTMLGSWTSTTSFSTARMSWGGTFSVLWGGYVYISAGCTAINGSGYCTTIGGDTQIASINADGSLTDWQSITASSSRIGYGLVVWRNVIYGIGGCTAHNTSNGNCTTTTTTTQYGPILQDGEASDVRSSVTSGTSPCTASTWTNCHIPPVGNGAGQGGQMAGGAVINNGFIYYMGGCYSVGAGNVCHTGNNGRASDTIYWSAIGADGNLIRGSTCGGTYYGSWCVDNTNTLNGSTGLAAFGYTVFNNVIYVIGGTDGSNWQSTVWRNPLNSDGTLGTWSTQTFANLDLGQYRGYSYVFARANPSSAGTYPGNLYVIGGCGGSTSTNNGLDCNGTQHTEVYKCNITTSGSLEEGDANDCTTSGQLQIDAEPGTGGSQGLGAMSGTVYANYIYLVGGQSPNEDERGQIMYARIDNSNNIVAVSGGIWQTDDDEIDPVRRRGAAFGYNGYLYALAGYNVGIGGSLNDLVIGKIDVSNGSIESLYTSTVTVTQRWDLRVIVNNGYAYTLGGCSNGSPPADCDAMTATVQTFQLYNNYSGSPAGYSAGANLFATDRIGASSAVLDGYLYIAGGCTSATDCTDATSNVQYASLSSTGAIGSWANTSNVLPADRAWGQLEVAGGNLYYLGGQDDTATNEQSTVYYASSFTSGNISSAWSTASGGIGDTASQAAQPRTKFGATVWNDRIYVVGGLDGSAAQTNTVFISPQLSSGGNIAADSWAEDSDDINVARHGNVLIAYANNLYSLGGHEGSNYLNDVQYTSIGYKVGTISQSGTTVTGSGTSWTSFMVGSELQYSDGSKAEITGYTSATSLTVDVSKTISAGSLYVIQDGSIGSWSYTTSMPTRLRQGDGFAVNGFMYIFGGRSADATCDPKTLVAPISANTTIATGNNPTGVGDWYETNVKYTGNRYGASAVYSDGKAYLLGGGCGATVTYTGANRVVQTALQSQPQIARYSRFIDTDTDIFPTKWLMNGLDNSTGAEWYMRYRSSTSSAASWGQETNFGKVILSNPEDYIPRDSGGTDTNFSRYHYFNVTIDSQFAYGYPEDVNRGPTISDLSLFFTSDPSKRLRHGKTFTGGEQQPLDTPF